MADIAIPAKPQRLRRLHPFAIRIMHWTNAVAMFIMIVSGWKIYNDDALFRWLRFPESITIGIEAQGALQWHFLGMWIFTVNLLVYIVYGLVTGRFWRKLLPIWPRQIVATSARRFASSSAMTTSRNTIRSSGCSMSASSS